MAKTDPTDDPGMRLAASRFFLTAWLCIGFFFLGAFVEFMVIGGAK